MAARLARLAFGMAGVLAGVSGRCQAPPPTLLSAREVLGDILKQSRVPPCTDASQLMAAKNDDAQFLIQRLKQAGWKTVSPDYVSSLDVLSKALRQIGGDSNAERACDRLRMVLRDLHTKRQDCEVLGHSRTNIRVEVLTLAGKDSVNGLEVYWRWIPAGDLFDTVPKRLGSMSSPALGMVPVAGEYELFAKDPASGKTTNPERVSIGGTEIFHWSLPVYFAKVPGP